ncbi:sugar ABC transporter ATP-binding protein [Paenibacillus lupini]|uniref:sugar ABC transporter ATP-binding protein n=1 Tax=Paenibacillus lupini TaxID=1450204 RepID=UPI00141EF784|nr:sugar ABC transporter ATP-binding protein [Paenibacillus lupini]NIK23233.1 ribose transport system ATP-binding protein [Paenibacillus lupini]
MELLKMDGITKAFYGVTVLDRVSLSVNRGEVHALLGENGAGKSTLMNILAGVHSKDNGLISFDGREITQYSIKSAEQHGIAFVHQELNIFNDLRVYENVFLGKELTGPLGRLRKKEMVDQTCALMGKLGVDIDPMEYAGSLDTGKKQLLEIAKVLQGEAKLFILDEPTTALNNEEIERLFFIIRRLKNAGKSFIFISHKMPEIFRIADRFTVLRNGKLVVSNDIKHTTPEEIARHMVGERYSSDVGYEERTAGVAIVEIQQLSGRRFHNVNLNVKKGEIIAFTGLEGAGCSELLQTIFGVLQPHSGRLLIYGRSLQPHSIRSAMKLRIAMVPASRKENSVIPDLNLLENTYLSEHAIHSRQKFIFKKRELQTYEELRKKLAIKAGSYRDMITSLSGGNQQKIILARSLRTNADLILFDNPTQGIDIGAKHEIYKLILELAKQGKTIIVNTLEMTEIQKIADRCAVFYRGTIMAILNREEINEERVMLHATNAIVPEERSAADNERQL